MFNQEWQNQSIAIRLNIFPVQTAKLYLCKIQNQEYINIVSLH